MDDTLTLAREPDYSFPGPSLRSTRPSEDSTAALSPAIAGLSGVRVRLRGGLEGLPKLKEEDKTESETSDRPRPYRAGRQ